MIKRIIIQSSDQRRAQHKPASPVSIPLAQNSKDFQLADNVFNHHALTRQGAISLLLRLGQRTALRLFHRRSSLFVQLHNALITRIGQTFCVLSQPNFAAPVKRANRVWRLWQNEYPRFFSFVCKSESVFLSYAAFSFPNNIVFVFFRAFNWCFGNINHDNLNLRQQMGKAFAG